MGERLSDERQQSWDFMTWCCGEPPVLLGFGSVQATLCSVT